MGAGASKQNEKASNRSPNRSEKEDEREQPTQRAFDCEDNATQMARVKSAASDQAEMRQQNMEDEMQLRERKRIENKQRKDIKMQKIMKCKEERMESHMPLIILQQFCSRRGLNVTDVGTLSGNREILSRKRAEKAKLLYKLSEIAGMLLKHNNPNLTDLSDENRPKKLVDRLSELYDNEWTDIFERVGQKLNYEVDDEDIICYLRDILSTCYVECQQMVKFQQQNILKTLVSQCPSEENPSLMSQINSFQKKTVEFSLVEFYKKMKQLVREKNKKSKCQVLRDSDPAYLRYVDGCTDIMWHTQVQSPPLVLEFDKKNKDWYRRFTSAGENISYIVWPAVFLHEDGPLLAKGIAQFLPDKDTHNRTEDLQPPNENMNTDENNSADDFKPQTQSKDATLINGGTADLTGQSFMNTATASNSNTKPLPGEKNQGTKRQEARRQNSDREYSTKKQNRENKDSPDPIRTNVTRNNRKTSKKK